MAEVAHREGVGYFRRFEVMRQWDQNGALGPATLTGREGLEKARYCCADHGNICDATERRGCGAGAKEIDCTAAQGRG